jgi:hypothetical protein
MPPPTKKMSLAVKIMNPTVEIKNKSTRSLAT